MDSPVAIVTGAGQGIGRATAIELARLGYRVALAGRTRETLEETSREIGGGRGLVVVADVGKAEEAQPLARWAIDEFGRVDVLVNNAGYARLAGIEELTNDLWRQIIDTNLSAAFYLSRALWPTFRKQQAGVIVNISSLSSRDPFPGLAAYGAAKAGLNLLGLGLAREGAAIGVRVHTLALGAVETAMFRSIRTEEQFPRSRTLSPAEVATVIGKCATGELRYTSGEVIYLHKGTA